MSIKALKAKNSIAQINITLENKCDFCVQSICCTYVTQAIDTPRSIVDFDNLFWQLSHQNIQAYKDEDGWYLCILNSCVHLLPGGACGIYERRPKICREHSNECCEFDGPVEDEFDLYFDGHESLDNYCRKRFKNWDNRFKKWSENA